MEERERGIFISGWRVVVFGGFWMMDQLHKLHEVEVGIC
jgi:hypothetical protein